MSSVRIYLLFSIMVSITFLALGSVNSVYATNIILDGQANCEAAFLSGSWSGNTCTLSNSLTIATVDTLTVTNGIILAFSTNDNLINKGDITNNGIITIEGTSGNNNGLLLNQNNADFTNLGIITITGNNKNNGQLRNQNDADFTNSGSITISGNADNSGRLLNQQTSDFTNSGTITITGNIENSGLLRNQNTASITNSGTITITGTSNNSGQLRNQNTASITNSGTITLTGINDVSGLVINLSVLTNSGSFTTNNGFNNNNANSVITNSGILQVTLNLNNNNGLISNNCGEITFGILSGNPIQEEICQTSSFGSSNAYEDPTIGRSHDGKQVVENGICIDIKCWTVTGDYHQDFELVEMLSDSTHTITTTVFCQNGVNKCNYVAFGVSPYGTNINDSVWKIILQKDHLDNWTMKVIDPDGYLGEVTSTTQIVNDGKHFSASVTIEFKKPTPGMILNIEVRDSGGGYRDFKFNDGIAIADAYAYPSIETSYEPPLEIAPLCINENPNKRYTCAFNMVREWTIKNAEAALEQITK